MHKTLQRTVLAVLLIGTMALAFTYRDELDVDALEAWVTGAGFAGPLLFMTLYAPETLP